jgi:hypothetical protein
LHAAGSRQGGDEQEEDLSNNMIGYLDVMVLSSKTEVGCTLHRVCELSSTLQVHAWCMCQQANEWVQE